MLLKFGEIDNIRGVLTLKKSRKIIKIVKKPIQQVKKSPFMSN
jgi:hypothetical protein